jgi:hypothetical protein
LLDGQLNSKVTEVCLHQIVLRNWLQLEQMLVSVIDSVEHI